MAMTRKPDSKAEMAADKKKGIKPGSKADQKQDLFGGKRANPFAKKGKKKGAPKGKAPQFGAASKNIFGQ
jgi:hypothetical protein